jgi:hypothetical protein
MLSKDAILSIKPKIQKLAIPEWGGEVYIRALSGADRDAFEECIVSEQQKAEVEKRTFFPRAIRARFAIYAVCDENR